MAQRGQMVQRGPTKWLVRVYTGKSPTGKNTYVSKVVHGTTSEARKALTALLRQHDTQSLLVPSKLTLAAYVEQWLAGKIDVTPRTRVSYESQLGYFLRPLGHRKLTDLNGLQIQQVIATMVGQGLSPRTVEYATSILRGAFQDAIRQGLLHQNPCAHLTLPKKAKRPPTVLSVEQVRALFLTTADSKYGILWRLLLSSGLRPQEALGLAWQDVDLTEGWLSVRQTLSDDGHGRRFLSDSVKADSQRRVALPSSTVEALKSHRTRQMALGLVFQTAGGRPLDMNAVRRAWKLALMDAGLPQVRLYDTRHSHFTQLLASGADIAWIADRAGHSSPAMTMAHYAHVLPETQRRMGEMTEALLQGTGG